MTMLGSAALVLWFEVSPDVRAELAHWHAHEHFPERLGVPGFLRGSRWTAADGGDGFFVVYELQDHAVLASPPYVARLNAPSPWSVRMMPLHRQMVRAQCRVAQSHGAITAQHALSLRCAPLGGEADGLQRGFQALATAAVARPGIVGLHLLRHDAPALAPTTEQKIRGHADRAADWIIVACAYDLDALRALDAADLGEPVLQAWGVSPGSTRHLHTFAYSATPADVR